MAERIIPAGLAREVGVLEVESIDRAGIPITDLMVNYLYRQKESFFRSPLSLSAALAFRERYFLDYARIVANGTLEEWFTFELAGTVTGFMTQREVENFHAKSSAPVHDDDWEIRARQVYHDSMLVNKQIVSTVLPFDESTDRLIKTRGEGSRSVVIFGAFDLTHIGHATLFDEAKILAGPFGTVTAFVSSDAEVRLKGNDRPYLNQRVRVDNLVGHGSIDFVVPMSDNCDVPQSNLYYDLSGKIQYDFRMVGPGEDRQILELYRLQAVNSGGLLVVGDRPRVASTSGYAGTVLNTRP